MTITSPVTRFVVRVLGWIALAFAVWGLVPAIGSLLVWPAGQLAAVVAEAAFGDLLKTVTQGDGVVNFVTTLHGATVGQSVVSVPVDARLYASGVPLFAALTLAARQAHRARTLAIGYAVLLPVVAWGVIAEFLKNVAITAGPGITSQTGFTAGEREAIAFAFQLGSLILPTVVPAIVWVLTHRTFVLRTIAAPRAA